MERKEKLKTRDVWSLILLVLIVATFVFIWTNSMDGPEASNIKSRWVMQLITPFLEIFVGKGNVTAFLVRKLAHFTEFGLLGAELTLMLILRKRKSVQWLVNIASLFFVTAAIDETIQIFADRGSTLLDVWLDVAGAVCGIVSVLVIYGIGSRMVGRRKRKRSVKNVRAMRDEDSEGEISEQYAEEVATR